MPLGEVGAQFEMRGVRKAFGGTVALDGVDLAVRSRRGVRAHRTERSGQEHAHVDSRRRDAPDAGMMTLNGEPYAPKNPGDARHAGVAMIYQELSLAPHLSVMDNIALGVEPARLGAGRARDLHRDAMRRTARAALDQLGHSEIPVDTPRGRAVAGGTAARRNCARAGVRMPRARARRADEQPGAWRVRRLFELIRRLNQQGLAIVYISHFIEEVMQVSDRFVVLRDGRNAGEGVT